MPMKRSATRRSIPCPPTHHSCWKRFLASATFSEFLSFWRGQRFLSTFPAFASLSQAPPQSVQGRVPRVEVMLEFQQHSYSLGELMTDSLRRIRAIGAFCLMLVCVAHSGAA